MTSYKLTPEQLAFYDENGYLLLRNGVPDAMLERLQAAGRAWTDDGIDATPQFAWNVDAAFRPLMTDDEETELRIAHLVHMGGSYCSAGNAG
jgi:hypothetical protein